MGANKNQINIARQQEKLIDKQLNKKTVTKTLIKRRRHEQKLGIVHLATKRKKNTQTTNT